MLKIRSFLKPIGGGHVAVHLIIYKIKKKNNKNLFILCEGHFSNLKNIIANGINLLGSLT